MGAYDKPLSAEKITERMTAIMRGSLPEQEIREFLTGLAARGETGEEIAAATRVLRTHAVALPLAHSYPLCDTCGTGGDGHGTINVSTLTGLIIAAAGVRVSKHGNRAASSKCGSADLLEALGLNLAATPAQVAACVDQLGFGFCFAPQFHPAMKAVAPIRKSLGIRTIFNLIGPLANPAPITYQIVGVSERRLMRPIADALAKLGVKHGLVVHGADGLDEISTTGPTWYIDIRPEQQVEGVFEPAQFGVPPAMMDALRGGDAACNARHAKDILSGQQGPMRDLVIVNAAAALYAADHVGTFSEGVTAAAGALDSGSALKLVKRLREMTA